MTRETISAYVVRNMLTGILDDVKFLIRVDDANKPILMDENTLKRFKDARACLNDLAFQQKTKYTDLANLKNGLAINVDDIWCKDDDTL